MARVAELQFSRMKLRVILTLMDCTSGVVLVPLYKIEAQLQYFEAKMIILKRDSTIDEANAMQYHEAINFFTKEGSI